MQDLIKRYFWVLGALVVMTCAVFAAKATGHVIEAKFLGDPKTCAKAAAIAPTPTVTTPTRSKDGEPMAARNMFCSDCTPAVPVASTSTDPSSIQLTALPLMLVATSVGSSDDNSFATIVHTENQRQGSFSIGDPVPGATGVLKAIKFKYVDFENNGHLERIVLVGVAPPPVVAAAEPPPSDENKDELKTSIDHGIKKIDDN